MPDAQRHDKLPLMNGPTAHLLALHNEDKEERWGTEERKTRKERSPVVRTHPCDPSSKSHQILSTIFIFSPFASIYRISRIQIAKISVKKRFLKYTI